jgi:hypothetical protein
MIERDFIMRILQEFFEAIAKVIQRQNPGQEPDVSYIQERFNEMYNQFFRCPAEHFYTTEKEIILDNLELEGRSEDDVFARMQMLSELLYQDALIKKDIPERISLLEKSLYLFEYLDNNSRTFSWDRRQKIEDIKKIMVEF